MQKRKSKKPVRLTLIFSTPNIHQCLGGYFRFQTLKVTGKVDKSPLFIIVDSDNIHNFINTQMANKLNYTLTPIRPLAVEATNGGKMT